MQLTGAQMSVLYIVYLQLKQSNWRHTVAVMLLLLLLQELLRMTDKLISASSE